MTDAQEAGARELSKALSLDDVKMISFSGSTEIGSLRELGRAEARIGTKVETRTEPESKTVVVRASMEVKVAPKDDPDHLKLEIVCTFELRYSGLPAEAFLEEDLDRFGNGAGLQAAWPYMREFVQSATARMNLPPLTISPLKQRRATQSHAEAVGHPRATGDPAS